MFACTDACTHSVSCSCLPWRRANRALGDGEPEMSEARSFHRLSKALSQRERPSAHRRRLRNAHSVPPSPRFALRPPPSAHQCQGPSMLPTFNPSGDVVIQEHISVWAGARSDAAPHPTPQNPRARAPAADE